MMGQTNFGRRIGVAITTVVASVLLGLFALSPQLTLRGISAAAFDSDSEKLSRLIDFQAVRASLADDVTDMIQRRTVQRALISGSDVTFSRTSSSQRTSAAVADRLLQQAITPRALSSAVQGQPIALDGGWRSQERQLTFGTVEASARYRNPMAYVVTVLTASGPFERYEVEFRRSGLFGWRAMEVRALGPRILTPDTPARSYAASQPADSSEQPQPTPIVDEPQEPANRFNPAWEALPSPVEGQPEQVLTELLPCTVTLSEMGREESIEDTCRLGHMGDDNTDLMVISVEQYGMMLSLRGTLDNRGQLLIRSYNLDGGWRDIPTPGYCLEGNGTYTCSFMDAGGMRMTIELRS